MKKITFLLAFFLFVFASCEKKEDPIISPPLTTNHTLPQTISNLEIYTGENGIPEESTYTITFTYNGNKISRINSFDKHYLVYTYTGNYITKVVEFDKNNQQIQVSNFVYENGKLKTVLEVDTKEDVKRETNYEYGSDGTITETENELKGESKILKKTSVGYFVNGNKIKEIKTEFIINDKNIPEVYYEDKHEYEYDNKNNPFKNIIGFFEASPLEISSANNVLKKTSVSKPGNNLSITQMYEYKYNVNNFPVSSKRTKISSNNFNHVAESNYTY